MPAQDTYVNFDNRDLDPTYARDLLGQVWSELDPRMGSFELCEGNRQISLLNQDNDERVLANEIDMVEDKLNLFSQ